MGTVTFVVQNFACKLLLFSTLNKRMLQVVRTAFEKTMVTKSLAGLG